MLSIVEMLLLFLNTVLLLNQFVIILEQEKLKDKIWRKFSASGKEQSKRKYLGLPDQK